MRRRGTIRPHDEFAYQAERQVIVPADREEVGEEELHKKMTRFLNANNPQAPHNLVRFSLTELAYKPVSLVSQEAVHFELDGWLLHVDSEEGRAQSGAPAADTAETGVGDDDEEEGDGEGDEEGDEAVEAVEAGVNASMSADADEGAEKRLRNQFNYSERASQSFVNPPRERGSVTEPAQRTALCAAVTQADIYDAYAQEYERARAAREKQKTTTKAPAKDEKKEAATLPKTRQERAQDLMYSETMASSLKVLERMVHQNSFHEIAYDFRYWDDAADTLENSAGSVLPLWTFTFEKARRKHVTTICWNKVFPDLFAVGFGSYDFMKQTNGVVCCFSLKNPEFPEQSFVTESGVMSVDFHHQHASLLAVGLYDGTVMVYDLQSHSNKPLYQSTTKSGKHTDPVWMVRWQEEDIAKNLNFFSISSDGRVTAWTLSKNELQWQDVMELKIMTLPSRIPEAPEEETQLLGLAGGCCMDFNPSSDHLFLVGTEEGNIHRCSKAYSSQYLDTYEGHHMMVYSLRWNPYHARAFLSCSADWTVRLWDQNLKKPVLTYDLKTAVGDVAWAPYSSTIFAAVTADGKIHIFDLSVNKYEPVCVQQVVKKAKLTRVVFNMFEPLVMVGDDHGYVISLKLSPSLRKFTPSADPKAFAKAQSDRLEEIISFAERSELNLS